MRECKIKSWLLQLSRFSSFLRNVKFESVLTLVISAYKKKKLFFILQRFLLNKPIISHFSKSLTYWGLYMHMLRNYILFSLMAIPYMCSGHLQVILIVLLWLMGCSLSVNKLSAQNLLRKPAIAHTSNIITPA